MRRPETHDHDHHHHHHGEGGRGPGQVQTYLNVNVNVPAAAIKRLKDVPEDEVKVRLELEEALRAHENHAGSRAKRRQARTGRIERRWREKT